MTEHMLAYFAFMAGNVLLASLTTLSLMGSLWPTIAFGVVSLAAVSVVVSIALLLLLFVCKRNHDDTTSEEENQDQMAYLAEVNRLRLAKVEARKKTC